jgi:hypothetical protein
MNLNSFQNFVTNIAFLCVIDVLRRVNFSTEGHNDGHMYCERRVAYLPST